jgi:hypothetical protein
MFESFAETFLPEVLPSLFKGNLALRQGYMILDFFAAVRGTAVQNHLPQCDQ